MRHSVLPIIGVLSVVAGAVGLQIGESAIAQIDPHYFQGPAGSPRDVRSDPRPQRAPGFAQASGWEEGYAARAADCPDCPAMMARQAHAPASVYAAPAYAAPPATRWEYATAEDALRADEARIERSVASPAMQRYLHYPVSADQEQIAQSVGAEEALPPEPQTEPAAGPSGL